MVSVLLLAFLPLAATPEAEGVSSHQVMKWIDACERKIDCLHGFVLLRHGKVIAEGSWKPYDTLNETHWLSSHTKCFTTTAIGMLVDEGKLDLDERVVDILPDKLPAVVSENLRMVRIRDLMTMNFGSEKSERWHDDMDGDWAKAILASSFSRKPGQAFAYDSSATHLLGIIVARRSGKPLMDFLRERLFLPLGIEKAWTTFDPSGNPCAAWGFNLTTREISLIGQLHLDRGVWQGRRLLSEDWVDLATTKQTWSGKTPTERQANNDWLQGFGFSWWRCQHGCYRADGSGGQYTIVMPRYDAVLSINADVADMQPILDLVWSDFLPAFSENALPDDSAVATALKDRCAHLALSPVKGRADGLSEDFYGRDYVLTSAPRDLISLRLEKAGKGWCLQMTTTAGVYRLPVGFGTWEQGTCMFSTKKHQPYSYFVGSRRVASSAAVQEDGSLRLRMLLLSGPRRIDLTFRRKMFRPTVEGRMEGASPIKAKLW